MCEYVHENNIKENSSNCQMIIFLFVQLFVYVYICVTVYLCVCISVCTTICVCLYIRVCVYLCACISKSRCMCIFVCVYLWVCVIEKPLELPSAFYFLLSRREQNDHVRFGVLFVTYPKSKCSLFYITFYQKPIKLFDTRMDDFIFQILEI